MRLASRMSAVMLILPALSAAQRATNTSENSEALDPYVACQYSLGLSVVSTVRRPTDGAAHRTVQTARGERKVSVIDGYQVLLSQGEPAYFANMKVERSDPRQYASDKDATIKNLEFLMDQSPVGKPLWEHMPYRGFDVYGVSDGTMEGNGPNGMHVLFRDSTNTIVTIYFLGQPPQFRKYTTIDGYEALRDKMLEELTACANRPVVTSAATGLPPLRTSGDVDLFLNKYYLEPRPERIAQAIEAVGTSGVLDIPQAIGPLTAFFAEVFAANPERIAEWQRVIDKQPARSGVLLAKAVAWSKSGGVLQFQERTPETNDLYWGAFFATGNPVFVKKLLTLAPFAAERNDFSLWSTGASAKWSLASNAAQHPAVRSILEDARLGADKPTQDVIKDLLTRGPDRIGREMAQIYERQKAAGKWK